MIVTDDRSLPYAEVAALSRKRADGLVALGVRPGARDEGGPGPIWGSCAARARAAGDEVRARELPDCDHFDLIDPRSAAWPAVRDTFRAAGQLPGRSSSLAP